jgi:predicted RNA-binding protein with PUA-like domain
MRFWIIKGNPARNDLDAMLVPGQLEPWVTRKPPSDWAEGDGVFFWKSAPALRLVGLGRIESVRPRNESGDTWFDLRYLTAPLEAPLSIADLRADPVVGDASFLKAGAAGTVFPLTDAQARHLLHRLTATNPTLRDFAWDDAGPVPPSDAPTRALSLRQPWAELVLRGEKTIEARSLRTNIRERVHIYASLGDVDAEDQTRVRRQYGLDIESLPRGVLVGTVVVVGCRPLTVGDSRAAAFPVTEADTKLFAWLLESPQRAERLVKPTRHPQPVWFTPF